MVDLLGGIAASTPSSSYCAMGFHDLIKLNPPRLAPALQGVRSATSPINIVLNRKAALKR